MPEAEKAKVKKILEEHGEEGIRQLIEDTLNEHAKSGGEFQGEIPAGYHEAVWDTLLNEKQFIQLLKKEVGLK